MMNRYQFTGEEVKFINFQRDDKNPKGVAGATAGVLLPFLSFEGGLTENLKKK